MKGDNVYFLMTVLIIAIIVELSVALLNQYYVPYDKKYNELTPIQKVLSSMRFYFNIIESLVVIYVLFNYSSYFNHLFILLLVFILLACARYFFFELGLGYYFVERSKRNYIIFDFMEETFGKLQNIAILFLLMVIIVRIYIFKIY
jgi:hypothetical protein